jgi:hypothetical protein
VLIRRLPRGCTGQNGSQKVIVCQVEIFGLGRGLGLSLIGRFHSWGRSIGFGWCYGVLCVRCLAARVA